MINFKFIKSQFRRVRVPVLIFAIISFFLIFATLVLQDRIVPSREFTKAPAGGPNSGSFHTKSGAGNLLYYTFLGTPGFALMFILSIILNHILISKEIEAGYMASWLTSSMSRRTVTSSKLFVLLVSILSIPFALMILQLLVFPFSLKDFNSDVLGRLVLMNFDFMFVVAFFISINWLITNFFSKGAYSISIISALAAIFIIMGVVSLFDKAVMKGMLGWPKYLTMTSFLNTTFNFSDERIQICLPRITALECQGDYVELPELLKLETLDYAWQMPMMAVLTPGIFVFGSQILIKKDLHL